MVGIKQINLDDLRALAKKSRKNLWEIARCLGREPVIFLHWSAGHYKQPFPDYHINIDNDGSIYVSVEDLSERLAHTWHHNSGAIGVALLCCASATPNNFGSEPPTSKQIECMAQIVAILALENGITIDFNHVRTHAEQADLDGYGPATSCERWDLWFFPGIAKGKGGEVLRGKAIYYLQHSQ